MVENLTSWVDSGVLLLLCLFLLLTHTLKAKATKWIYTNGIISDQKASLPQRETIGRIKGQTAEWEKIFAHHLSDEEVIFRIYQELNIQQENLIFFKEEKLSE